MNKSILKAVDGAIHRTKMMRIPQEIASESATHDSPHFLYTRLNKDKKGSNLSHGKKHLNISACNHTPTLMLPLGLNSQSMT